jgi:hypothetical protein
MPAKAHNPALGTESRTLDWGGTIGDHILFFLWSYSQTLLSIPFCFVVLGFELRVLLLEPHHQS